MDYLSKQGIIHRDLAARNLLVNVADNGVPTVKVADFGLSRKIVTGAYYVKSGNSGDPIFWAAPESFKRVPGAEAVFKGRVSTRSDRWSFGVVLFEMFHLGQRGPFDGVEKQTLRTMMIEKAPVIKYLKIEDAPVKVNELIRDLLNYDSHSRPDFSTILERLNEAEKELNEKPELNVWQHTELPVLEAAKGRTNYDEGSGGFDFEEDGEESTLQENA
eukprot:TRINITY_DN10141_c0_g2_i1.p1 TRINITY_DN10141_c0_g2~~TRINITY_DN10141_c0_g2_i1.p1  ORF type:complete len:217 (-),score=66.08 TRINITY_DN10141_c0_g2_i1:44-694(-)